MSQQSITITGHLTHPPRLIRTGEDQYKCELRIASSRRVRDDKNPGANEWRDTDLLFITAEVWDQFAINVRKSLHRGMPVVVVGSLVFDSWSDEQGKKANRMYLKASFVGLDLRRYVTAARKNAVVYNAEGTGSACLDLGENGLRIDEDRFGQRVQNISACDTTQARLMNEALHRGEKYDPSTYIPPKEIRDQMRAAGISTAEPPFEQTPGHGDAADVAEVAVAAEPNNEEEVPLDDREPVAVGA